LERLIIPAIESGYYDYIIQDRGIMSGAIYAACCGNNKRYVDNLISFVTSPIIRLRPYVYDSVFVFHNQDGLNTALNAKDEFAGLGDAMESRGAEFHDQVNKRFRDACASPDHWSFVAKKMHSIDVHGKTTDDIVNRVVYMV
jgi:thymidylate kinase